MRTEDYALIIAFVVCALGVGVWGAYYALRLGYHLGLEAGKQKGIDVAVGRLQGLRDSGTVLGKRPQKLDWDDMMEEIARGQRYD